MQSVTTIKAVDKDSPSSKVVPTMKGMRGTRPLAYSSDGRAGTMPPFPSMTGEKAICEYVEYTISVALMILSVLAERRQSKVLLKGNPVHSATEETRISHAVLRVEASNKGTVAAEPDSNIYDRYVRR